MDLGAILLGCYRRLGYSSITVEGKRRRGSVRLPTKRRRRLFASQGVNNSCASS